MQEDQFWLLVSLQLSGEATEDELAVLEIQLQQHPEWKDRYNAIAAIWKERQQTGNTRKEELYDKHLQRLSNHLSEPILRYETSGNTDISKSEGEDSKRMTGEEYGSRSYPLKWLWPLSGVAAAVIVFFIFFERSGNKTSLMKIAQNSVSTKPGSKSKIQLPDGTQVWLNADSRITYNENFGIADREVQLTGEAYFDVTKDKLHPFIIHTSAIDIRILGTSLNVRSYLNEAHTETVLIHGSIEVTLRNNPNRTIILKPNDKLVVQNDNTVPGKGRGNKECREEGPLMVLGKPHFQKEDSLATDVLWVKNKLAFDRETLENVALKIERWYDVKVIIEDADLKKSEYSGVFEDESLKQVMEALRLSGNFHYTLTKKEIIIKP
jgi:transmembrane sensor